VFQATVVVVEPVLLWVAELSTVALLTVAATAHLLVVAAVVALAFTVAELATFRLQHLFTAVPAVAVDAVADTLAAAVDLLVAALAA